ncbi:MAG: sortase [Solobacterium sp.]|nr:sortase [Solobacterium sp.]
MKIRNTIGKICIFIGLLCMLAGLFYGGWNYYRGFRAGEQSASILTDIQTFTAEKTESEPSVEILPDYVLTPEMEMPTIKVGDHSYIGEIIIPDLNLELPVMADWSYPQLDISPCRYMGSAYLDNLILMSHDYPQHFGYTYRLEKGARATFIDVEGNRFDYELVNTEELWPTDVEILEKDSDAYDLTIFACIYNGQMRTVGRFKRIRS